jgi:hypothetical protein
MTTRTSAQAGPATVGFSFDMPADSSSAAPAGSHPTTRRRRWSCALTSSREPMARDIVAYHEAGHAVAAYLMQEPIARVTIVPNGELGYEGRCFLGDPAVITDEPVNWTPPKFANWRRIFPDLEPTARNVWRDRDRRNVLVYLAGPAAHAIYCRRYRRPMDWDRCEVDYRLALSCAEFRFADEAEALRYLARISERVERVMSHPRQWAAVQAIAGELLAARTITGVRARVVIRRALRRAA